MKMLPAALDQGGVSNLLRDASTTVSTDDDHARHARHARHAAADVHGDTPEDLAGAKVRVVFLPNASNDSPAARWRPPIAPRTRLTRLTPSFYLSSSKTGPV